MRIHSSTLSGSLIVSQSGAIIDSGGFSGSFSGSFKGDGSNITGVTAEWDGTHTGDGTITGNLNVSGNITGSDFSGSSTSTGSFGNIIAGGHIIPTESGSFDLGSLDRPWKDLHILSSSIKPI